MKLFVNRRKTGFSAWLIAITQIVLIFAAFLPVSASSAATKQIMFESPEKAVMAFVHSLEKDDLASLEAILGPNSEQLVSSGDPVADRSRRQRFLSAYAESHRLDREGKGKVMLVVGKNEWPFPIPLVMQKNLWRFDTPAGRVEILNRRIGRNELETIQTCLAIVDAQREYAMNQYGGSGALVYAPRFASDPGTKNGLFWETKEGEEQSPMGELVAKARAEGYNPKGGAGEAAPYHGYLYRMMTGQGKNAEGGAYDYMVRGHMLGGFAVVAYPAAYGSSGVMTFIVNHDGIVYQKDLGPKTAEIASSMQLFDPGPGWKKVEAPTAK
jgi:hypothetical protein